MSSQQQQRTGNDWAPVLGLIILVIGIVGYLRRPLAWGDRILHESPILALDFIAGAGCRPNGRVLARHRVLGC